MTLPVFATMHFLDFPDEICSLIASVDYSTHIKLRATCRRLYNLLTEDLRELRLKRVMKTEKHYSEVHHVFSNIKHLKISSTNSKVLQLPWHDIVSLDISRNRKVTDSILSTLLAQYPMLTSLNVSECKITDATLDSLVKHTPGLRRLVLKRCADITAEGMSRLLGGCQELRYLNIAFTNACDAAIRLLTTEPELISLTVSDVSSIEELSSSCSQLQTLHIYETRLLSFPKMFALKQLSAHECKYSEKFFESLPESAPNLQRLKLLGEAFFSRDLRALHSLRHLHVLHLHLKHFTDFEVNILEQFPALYVVHLVTTTVPMKRLITQLQQQYTVTTRVAPLTEALII